MGMALTAIPDDRDLLLLDERDVGVLFIIDFHVRTEAPLEWT
jgi:hypothetical protein